jgi:hypothetical protein
MVNLDIIQNGSVENNMVREVLIIKIQIIHDWNKFPSVAIRASLSMPCVVKLTLIAEYNLF